MLTGPQRKFCEGIVSGLNGTEAYVAAYPRSSRISATTHAAQLRKGKKVRGEIARLRAMAAAWAVLTVVEKRTFLARLVRAQIARLPEDSELFSSITRGRKGVEFRLGDKLAAIKLDNDLAGVGNEAGVEDALTHLLRELRQ